MNRLYLVRFVGLCAACGLLLSACTSAPSKHLVEARSTYAQAAQHSHAARYAPKQLQDAKQSLARAERAYQESADDPSTHTLAYLALRHAQQAMASAELNYLATTRKARENELMARTDAARRHYQERFKAQKLSASAAQQMNEQQLEQQRRRLQEALDQLDEQQMSQADMQALETQYQDAMAQLDAEIERRKQVEARLDEATQQLAEIAEVRQNEGGATIISLDSATLFENGKYDLLPIARQNLKQVADALKIEPEMTLTVAGFTSSTGSADFNKTLSENRARAVKDYLVSRGIPGDRISTIGYGQERPIASNETSEGRAMNRRVEIILDNSQATGGGPDESMEQAPSEDEFLEDTSTPSMEPLPPVDQVIPRSAPEPGDTNFPQAPNDDLMVPEQGPEQEGMQPGSPDEDGILDEQEYQEDSDDWPAIIDQNR